MMTFFAVIVGIAFAGEIAVTAILFASEKARRWARNQIRIIVKECAIFLSEIDGEL